MAPKPVVHAKVVGMDVGPTGHSDNGIAGPVTPRRVAMLRSDVLLAREAFKQEVLRHALRRAAQSEKFGARGPSTASVDEVAERLSYLPPTESGGSREREVGFVGSVGKQLQDADEVLGHRWWLHPKHVALVERLVAAVAIHLTEVGTQSPKTQTLVLRLLQRDPSPSDQHRRAADVARRTFGPWSDTLRRSVVDALEGARATRLEELRRQQRLRRVVSSALIALIILAGATWPLLAATFLEYRPPIGGAWAGLGVLMCGTLGGLIGSLGAMPRRVLALGAGFAGAAWFLGACLGFVGALVLILLVAVQELVNIPTTQGWLLLSFAAGFAFARVSAVPLVGKVLTPELGDGETESALERVVESGIRESLQVAFAGRPLKPFSGLLRVAVEGVEGWETVAAHGAEQAFRIRTNAPSVPVLVNIRAESGEPNESGLIPLTIGSPAPGLGARDYEFRVHLDTSAMIRQRSQHLLRVISGRSEPLELDVVPDLEGATHVTLRVSVEGRTVQSLSFELVR